MIELLTIMSHQVVNQLLLSIRENIYSTICDEYTSCSNKEFLTFCLRWLNNNLDVIEHFLDFSKIPDIKSITIMSVIKDIIIILQLEFDKCHRQCYDGASNIIGEKSGVAQQIKVMQPKAHFMHYHGHSV